MDTFLKVILGMQLTLALRSDEGGKGRRLLGFGGCI